MIGCSNLNWDPGRTQVVYSVLVRRSRARRHPIVRHRNPLRALLVRQPEDTGSRQRVYRNGFTSSRGYLPRQRACDRVCGGGRKLHIAVPELLGPEFSLGSPFIWGLVALAYDTATMNATPLIRLGFTSSLAIIVLSITLLISSRLPSGEERAIYEPFRQSARWIQSLPACRGQVLPVVTTDDPAWYKPGYAEFIYESAYGRYLQGFAQPRLIFGKDLDRDKLPRVLKQEIKQRVSGGKCPVLVRTVHNMTPEVIAMVTDKLLRALDVPKETARISTKSFHDGALGYVIYVE